MAKQRQLEEYKATYAQQVLDDKSFFYKMFVLTIVIKQFQLVRGNAAQQDHYQRSLPAVLETLQVF